VRVSYSWRNDTADGYGIKLACYGKCVLLLSSAFNVEARYGVSFFKSLRVKDETRRPQSLL